MSVFDLAIIGGGPGGYSAALRGASYGLSVALMEKGEIGGTCLNRGCVPAKAWIAAAETVDHAANMAAIAASPFDYSIDFNKMTERQRKVTSQFQKSLAASLSKRGVRVISGRAEFASDREIMAPTAEGGSERIEFKNALIATGSEPARLFDVDPSLALDNVSIFDVPSLPESMLIVGAGAIGCEFATAMTRLGVRVTMVEMMDRVLPMEDHEISATLARELKKLKIQVITGAKIESLEPGGPGLVARLAGGESVEAEKALVSIGRRFSTSGLGLDKAGVETGRRGEILTDNLLRSSTPNIFAAGDVAGKNMLAYTAYREGCFVADYIAGKRESLPDTPVPSAIFTIPEIGSVGVREEDAPKGARKGTFMFRALARAHIAGEIAGFVKVIADGETDRLLGVHIIGPRATDLIHTASVALSQGMTARAFGDLLFAHPTFAEAALEAAHDVHGLSIHKQGG
ncbi:MAG: dihydrolipoyl dehydrogenase [Candidatus Nitrospinota bacterium M3_3B_026]